MKTQPNGHSKTGKDPLPPLPPPQRDFDLIASELDIVTAGELAAYLKKSREWVYRAKRERGLPFIQIDERSVCFQPKAVVEWLQTRKRNYPKPRGNE